MLPLKLFNEICKIYKPYTNKQELHILVALKDFGNMSKQIIR